MYRNIITKLINKLKELSTFAEKADKRQCEQIFCISQLIRDYYIRVTSFTVSLKEALPLNNFGVFSYRGYYHAGDDKVEI